MMRKSCLFAPAVLTAGSLAGAQTLPGAGADVVAPDVMRPAGEATEAAVAEAEAEDKISAALGVDYASHFVSYGADMWGGGDDFFGSESTTFVWAEAAFDLAPFTATLGVWSDVNNNGDDPLGGSLQEVDVYAGLAYSFGKFSVGATYQEWYYSDDEERIVDLSAAFDDSDLIWEGFAFNPSLLAHIRVDGNGEQEEGTAIVASIEPAFTLIESEDYPVTLAIPVSVAFFLEDDFQGGTEDGYAYSSIGATLSVPLAFIPEGYGLWSLAGNATYYLTEEDALPGNEEDEFLTGMVSLSLSF